MEPNSSNYKINSRHYSQSIESSIIQLTRTLAIEHQLSVDPDAKSMARRTVQNKLNQLYSEQELKTINDFVNNVFINMKAKKPGNELAYEVIQILGLDNAN